MKRKLLSLTVVLAITLVTVLFACVTAEAASKSALSYTVSVHNSGSGNLYWNLGRNMEFFVKGETGYNADCRISSGAGYKFSALVDRGIIAEPAEGWHFDGFYDKSGKRVSLKTTNINIIRITVKGIYFYDCIPSYDNPEYSRFTEAAYKEAMKTTLKALYGTRVYKVMGKAVFYQLPKKTASYYAKFSEMKAPEFPDSLTLSKKLEAPDFYIAKELATLKATYTSSASKIIKVDKTTGKAQVQGPGVAVITVKIPKTDCSLAATYKVKITVKPDAVTGLSAKRTSDQKYVLLNWKGNPLYSGYEIQISDSSSFSKITAKKTAASGKTVSTKVSTSKSAVCKYARIRPYKTSGGQKLYGPYVTCSVK